MAASQSDKHDLIDRRTRGKLRRLRAALGRRLLADGLAWLLLAVAGAVGVSLCLDYGLHRLTLSHATVGQRALIVALCLAGVGWVAARRLLRPLRLAWGEEDLALVVERRHPELSDRLISSLQFGTAPEAARRGVSAAMIARVAEQAGEMTRPLRFTDALRTSGVARHVLAAAVAVAALAGLSCCRPDLMKAWFYRNVLLAETAYPQATEIWVVDQDRLRAMRGGPLTIVVRADPGRVVPPEVTFHFRFPSVGDVREEVGLSDKQPDTYIKRIEMVAEPFRFYVTGNDARTREIEVPVLEPPLVKNISFSIARPEYMRLPVQTVSAAEGALKVPDRSWVTVRALATKELAGARILLEGEPVGECKVEPARSEPGGAERPLAVSGRFQVRGGEPFRPSLVLSIELSDTEGCTNPRGAQCTINVARDQPPTLQMELQGISGQVTRKAKIPMLFTAKDDYGVQEIGLDWSLMTNPDKTYHLLAERFGAPEPAPAALRFALDLQEDNSGQGGDKPAIEVGDSLRLIGVVRDTLPPPGGPNSFACDPVVLKIVTDEELMAGLLEAQRGLREQFRQTMVIQTEAKEKTETASRVALRPGALADARQTAAEVADLQQQVRDRLAEVTDRYQGLVAQMENNRVGVEADKNRIREKVVAPLQELLGGATKSLISELANAITLKEAKALSAELKRILAVQQGILSELESILGEMIQVENAQQIEQGLKNVIKKTEQVQEFTRSGGDKRPETKAAPEKKP